MLKQFVLASALMVSIPVWAATQAETAKPASASAAGAPAAETQAKETAGKAGSIQKEGARPAGKQADSVADTGQETPRAKPAGAGGKQAEPGPERKALLEERRKQQVLVFHLKAKRDSELNRLALARLAASRGGDPDFDEKKNQKMIKQMQDLGTDYDRQIAKAERDLDKIDERIARQEAREQGRGGKAAAQAGSKPVGQSADAAASKAVAKPAAQASEARDGARDGKAAGQAAR